MKVRYITHLSKLDGLTPEERRRLAPVAERYVFRLNEYYQQLIHWDDPHDPLAGVHRFKAGLGGQVVRHVGAWDYPAKPGLYRAYTAAKPILLRLMSF